MRDIKLGKSGGLDVTAAPSAAVCAVLMAAGLSAISYYVLQLPIISSIAGGITATVLHYDSELFHQQGHASAARRAGYPMIGMRYWTIFSSSIYPPDEPELPAETHIQRALGGPFYSLIMTVFAGLVLAFTYSNSGPSGLVFDVFLFFFLDNLLFFTLGAFLPLGFTDGSTLLRWRSKRNKQV
jgi:hypothetical protein